MAEPPPRDVVYGLWDGYSLVVLDADWAKAALKEVARWYNATTIGEARRLCSESPLWDHRFPKTRRNWRITAPL